jgi:hypothetical protein
MLSLPPRKQKMLKPNRELRKQNKKLRKPNAEPKDLPPKHKTYSTVLCYAVRSAALPTPHPAATTGR